MKTLTSLIALTLFFSSFSYANEENSTYSPSAKSALIHYVTAYIEGKTAIDEKLLAKDFQMSVQTINTEKKINKKEFTKFLKEIKGLTYNSKTSYNILDESPRCTIAKITMDFGHFTRVDYITLCVEDQDWKISKVVSTYP